MIYFFIKNKAQRYENMAFLARILRGCLLYQNKIKYQNNLYFSWKNNIIAP
jgi:hypothetical protein